MTMPSDDEIRKLDVPERFQERQAALERAGPQEAEALAAEAEWIWTKLNLGGGKDVKLDAEAVRDAIKLVIQYIREQQLEVPFIHCYRQEYLSILSLQNLWKIFDLDQE